MSIVGQEMPSWLQQVRVFAINFFKHPKMLGSLIPSSRFLINRLLSQIDWRAAEVIVEYGPGVGTISAHMLRRMRADATLVVFETNDDFVRFMQEQFVDPRLKIVHGSAADVAIELQRLGLDRADYIISGIPFSTIPAPVRESIMRATHDILQPNGAFLVYQFRSVVKPYLQQFFSRVEDDWEPLNIPPVYIYRSTK